MKILIATPAYGDVVYNGFHESVANMVLAFARAFPAIVFEHRLIDVPVLATARNILASLVLNDPSYTHLLFIDADMGFSPMLIARMLKFGKPFVGSIYPAKQVPYDAFAALAKDEEWSTIQARMIAANYICGQDVVWHEQSNGGQVGVVVDGFIRVRASGTGVMLLERRVLERMREVLPDIWLEEPGEQVRAWGLESGGLFRGFDTMVNSEGYHVGEDMAFCLRWVATGGEIWAAIDEAIVHSGRGFYRGLAIHALEMAGTATVRKTRLRSDGRGNEPWYARALRRTAKRR
jgi:hypothetical protein